MEDAGNGLNIIILDACRDNPFARSFRSSEKGLAKMDAPTGSFLAYATAPGSVAADGTGRNGLYTSKLLKYMVTPGLELEKLFKYVRIEVANSSGKNQVPWESSSLMGDFFFNPKRGIAVQSAAPKLAMSKRPPKRLPISMSKRPPKRLPISLTNSIGMEFVYIQPGTFMMGSPTNEHDRRDNENQHRVTLTHGFYMQTTEVTQGQWKAIMGSNPSKFKNCGVDCPVEKVSWNDVQSFIHKLNQREGSGIYRLPTEAEWEYAARAGSKTAFANGDISETECGYDSNLDAIGWYCGNASKTHPVAQKQPNAWGLYDMHGNIFEWCQDWLGNYPSGSATDPTGPSGGSRRVLRGGSYGFYTWVCRSAFRGEGEDPGDRSKHTGFRLLRNPSSEMETVPTPSLQEISRDGHYTAYATGVVYDKHTSLEWYAGPDRDTTWNEAKAWVDSLNVAGGGWRMPTSDELKTLYQKGVGTRNMTPLLKTTDCQVWSGKTRDSSAAILFYFCYGHANLGYRDFSTSGVRGFAVRSRRQ